MLPFLLPFSRDTSECNYLPNQTAQMPLYVAMGEVAPEQFDQLMESGFRRSGGLYYNTECPGCTACQPIRLEVEKFQPNRSQRRALSKAKELSFRLGPPIVDAQRVELFNRHRSGRGLSRSETPITEMEYQCFLLYSRNPSVELSAWLGDELLAVSITDYGRTCMSAVYCIFDPAYAPLSLGTVCVLKQIEIAQLNGMKWLYLGYYVAANQHLNYKTNFKPHQLRMDGKWRE